jgi:hypothetical protein
VIAPLTATFLQAWPAVRVELDLTNRMVDLVDEGSIWRSALARSIRRIWWPAIWRRIGW